MLLSSLAPVEAEMRGNSNGSLATGDLQQREWSHRAVSDINPGVVQCQGNSSQAIQPEPGLDRMGAPQAGFGRLTPRVGSASRGFSGQ